MEPAPQGVGEPLEGARDLSERTEDVFFFLAGCIQVSQHPGTPSPYAQPGYFSKLQSGAPGLFFFFFCPETMLLRTKIR